MDNLPEIFEFLDELRESGDTNMFGARPYVVAAFGLEPDIAGKAVSDWIKTFDRESSPEERAAKARGEQPQSIREGVDRD